MAVRLQAQFPHYFLTWLVFSKHFLYPKLIAGERLTKEGLDELEKAYPVPWFVKRARHRYRKMLFQFWEETCDSPHFTVQATASSGFKVIAHTSSVARLSHSLIGQYVTLSEGAYALLRKSGYNSLIQCKSVFYILYGPLQFVNHSCTSLLSIIELPLGFTIRYEYESDSRADRAGFLPPFRRGEEVLIKYAAKKHLGFTCVCGAKGCK